MPTSALTKVKNMLVASCEAIHTGNRDIASHMMEIALEELTKVTPEDVEITIQVADNTDVKPLGEVIGAFDDEQLDEEEVEAANYQSLRDIVGNMKRQIA